MIKSSQILGICSLTFIFSFTACGGGGNGTEFNNVTVTVSPTSATVAANGQVSIEAAVTGLPGGASPALNWTIAELQVNGASGAQCNWLGSTPPAGPCPDGTIQGADVQPARTVTYHGGGTTGTFHVTAQWSSASTPAVTKNATATITVTP